MKIKTIKLAPAVRAVLEASTITENSLKINRELDRELYMAVNKVLVAAGGKWNRSAQAHIFESDPRKILGLALETGSIVDEKKTFQAFYTPAWLALMMVERARIAVGNRVLEPSAGEGALVKQILAKGAICTAVEIRAESCAKLWELDPHRLGHLDVAHGDFLKRNFGVHEKYDRVLMNPPFTGDQDIDHVLRAFDCLHKNGRLLAIMSPGFTQNGPNKKRFSFLKFMLEQDSGHTRGVWEQLPEGTFKESGTNVNTVLVEIRKGIGAWD